MSDTTYTGRESDAERAAQLSILMTQEGRLELAEALLRIAIQAHRLETGRDSTPYAVRTRAVDIPFAGHARNERPVRLVRPAAPQDTPPDVTTVMSSENRRCRVTVRNGAFEAECHGPVYWVASFPGDDNHPATPGFWRHVDTELDNDHVPHTE